MRIFGCASDEQLKIEKFESALGDCSLKLKMSDLRKMCLGYSLEMEIFLKEKGLYQEFYDKKIASKIFLDNEVFLNANISR